MENDKSTPKNKGILKKQATTAPTLNKPNKDLSPNDRESNN